VSDLDRNAVIARIRAGLKKRSGKTWTVKGGRGTAWGWIKIDVPPSRCTFEWDGITPTGRPGCFPSLEDRKELAKLLGLAGPIHPQGEDIPASGSYRQEYIDRAEGRTPAKRGTPYWD